MKKLMVTMVMAALAAGTLAAKPKKPVAAAEEEAPTSGKDAKITIDQFPKTGKVSTLAAPGVPGGSIIGNVFTKPRKWIVLEAKYSTYARWQDQLTFTWHVILETKTATEKDKTDKLSPYSYFTTTTTYSNVPKGAHAASVCLHPSYLERFGEAKAIGLVISNAKGEILAGDSVSEIQGIKSGTKFWEDQKIMDAQKDGEALITRRQGLLDRSKTIWALVNPNDYELVTQ